MRNQQLVGQTAAALFDNLEDEEDENAEVKEVLVCVLVGYPDKGPEGMSQVQWYFSDGVVSHQRGLVQSLAEALAVRTNNFAIGEDEDDD